MISTINFSFARPATYPWQSASSRQPVGEASGGTLDARSRAALSRAARTLDQVERLLTPRASSASGNQPTVSGQGFTIGSAEASAARLRSSERINTAGDVFPDVAFDASGAGTPVEAESGTLLGDAKLQSDAAFSGGQAIKFKSNEGEGVRFDVSAGSAGAADLTFRYAADKSDGTMTLFVNGDGGTGITFAATGGKTTLADLTTSVALNAGANILELRNASGDSGTVTLDTYLFDDGSGTANLEDGMSVTDGSFTVNGESIDVFADDSIDDVLVRIDASVAGVSASFDAASQTIAIVSDATGSASGVTLANDTSGFLQATKLDTAVVTAGQDPGAERALAGIAHFGSVSSGTFRINGRDVAIDVNSDSLQDVLDAIDAADAGVSTSLVRSGDNHLVKLTGDESPITLDDGGTGILAALGISSGSHAFGSEASSQAARVRSYRVADALEELQQTFDTLLAGDGASLFRTALGALFDEVVDSVGARKLERLGLDFQGDERDVFDLNKSERRRFVQAMQLGDRTLFELMLEVSTPGGDGLIEALRALVKDTLASGNGGSRIGTLVDAYA